MSGNLCVLPSVDQMAAYVEVVQRRTFRVQSMQDVQPILRQLQREKFIGSVRINVGRGGVPSTIETESAIPALDNVSGT